MNDKKGRPCLPDYSGIISWKARLRRAQTLKNGRPELPDILGSGQGGA